MPDVLDKPRSTPSTAKANNTQRAHVVLPDALRSRLEEIMENTEKGSISEVIRDALRLYVLAYEEDQKDADLLIRQKDGTLERLRFFI